MRTGTTLRIGVAVTVSGSPLRSSTIVTFWSTRGRIRVLMSRVSSIDGRRWTPPDRRAGCRPRAPACRAGSCRWSRPRLGHRDDALRHRRDDRAGLGGGHPVDGDEDGQQDSADEQVHGRAAEHDDDLLGHRQLVEDPVLVAGTDLFQARRAGLVDGAWLNRPVLDTRTVPGSSPLRGGNMPIIRCTHPAGSP